MRAIRRAITGISVGAGALAIGSLTMTAIGMKANKELEELNKNEVLDEETNKKVEKLESKVSRINKTANSVMDFALGLSIASMITAIGLNITDQVQRELEEDELDNTIEAEVESEIEDMDYVEEMIETE